MQNKQKTQRNNTTNCMKMQVEILLKNTQ